MKQFVTELQVDQAITQGARASGLLEGQVDGVLSDDRSEIALYLWGERQDDGDKADPIAWLRWMEEYDNWQYVMNMAHPFVEQGLERGKAMAKGEI